MKARSLAIAWAVATSLNASAAVILPSSHGVLCLKSTGDKLAEQLALVEKDQQELGYLSQATKKAVLPDLAELTLADYWDMREEIRQGLENHGGLDVPTSVAMVLKEVAGKEQSTQARLDDFESRLKKSLPLFAQIYGWGASRIQLGTMDGQRLPADIYRNRTNLEAHKNCVNVGLAFRVFEPRGGFEETTTVIIDKDLVRHLADGFNETMLYGRERLVVVASLVGPFPENLVTLANRSFFESAFWADRDGSQMPRAIAEKMMQDDLALLLGDHASLVPSLTGLFADKVMVPFTPFSRTVRYGELKQHQTALFLQCRNRALQANAEGRVGWEGLQACRMASEDPVAMDTFIQEGETAFLYLVEAHLNYSEGQTRDASFLRYTQNRPGIEHLLDLSDSDEGEAFDARQKLALDYCADVVMRGAFVQMQSPNLGNIRELGPSQRLFKLATDYCDRFREVTRDEVSSRRLQKSAPKDRKPASGRSGTAARV